MKKEDLKKLIKPIVQECIEESIHEVLFESGIVTSIIAEVLKGVDIPKLVESVARPVAMAVPQPVDLREHQPVRQMAAVVSGQTDINQVRREHQTEMNSQRTRLEEQMNSQLGINIFEGTSPVLSENNGQGPLSDMDPNDPGIDLTAIPGLRTLNFKGHLKE